MAPIARARGLWALRARVAGPAGVRGLPRGAVLQRGAPARSLVESRAVAFLVKFTTYQFACVN